MSFWSSWVWDGAHIAVGTAQLLAAGVSTAWLLRRRSGGVQRQMLIGANGQVLSTSESWDGAAQAALTGLDLDPPVSYRCTSPRRGRYCKCRFCTRAKAFYFETGKPKRNQCIQRDDAPYRCDFCGDKCRKHIWHAGWSSWRYSDKLSFCRPCVEHITGQRADELDWSQWMHFDIVRYDIMRYW